MAKDIKRMNAMALLLDGEGIEYERRAAIDGKQRDNYRADISDKCKVICTDGMVGCGLSHLYLWRHVVENKLERVLVFEDDVQLVNGYKDIFKRAIKQLPIDWDILYFGCHGLCDKKREYGNPFMRVFHIFKKGSTDLDKENIFVPEYPLATHAYGVSYEGCKKLIRYIEKVGYHIDVCIARNQARLKIYACYPNIAYQNGDDSTMADKSFPVTLNRVLSQVRDDKNFGYDYFLTAPVSRGINLWTIIFLVLGMIGKMNVYVRNGVLLLFLIELKLNNVYYLMSVVMFTIGYKLL
jgi:GR25 family glycosyltransferase involved in LPS biosynthesis